MPKNSGDPAELIKFKSLNKRFPGRLKNLKKFYSHVERKVIEAGYNKCPIDYSIRGLTEEVL